LFELHFRRSLKEGGIFKFQNRVECENRDDYNAHLDSKGHELQHQSQSKLPHVAQFFYSLIHAVTVLELVVTKFEVASSMTQVAKRLSGVQM
jgi:hypothetical protein